MKRVLSMIFVVLLIFSGCMSTSYINAKDNIPDKDEKIIKEFRSHHGYSNNELKNLDIKYLGTIDDYNIYYVPYKGKSDGEVNWAKDGYTFPIVCQTRIIGIKSNKLYTIGNLIFETQINIKKLYEMLPVEFKSKQINDIPATA